MIDLNYALGYLIELIYSYRFELVIVTVGAVFIGSMTLLLKD